MTNYDYWASDGIEGGEGCVQMNSTGQWFDTQCSGQLPYLCKQQTDGKFQMLTKNYQLALIHKNYRANVITKQQNTKFYTLFTRRIKKWIRLD